MKIGIIGAGFIGRAVARLAIKHGDEVMISNSRHPKTLASAVASIRCHIGTAKEAAQFGDVVLVAIPFSNIDQIEASPLAGKIVMDANNYYPQRDGQIAEVDAHQTTTSEMLARHLGSAKVVKVFNAILERDIENDAQPVGAPKRRALPIAGDDSAAKKTVAEFLDRIGYDALDAGPLAEGWRFERARPAYCVPLDKAGLQRALAAAGTDPVSGVEVPDGSWRG